MRNFIFFKFEKQHGEIGRQWQMNAGPCCHAMFVPWQPYQKHVGQTNTMPARPLAAQVSYDMNGPMGRRQLAGGAWGGVEESM